MSWRSLALVLLMLGPTSISPAGDIPFVDGYIGREPVRFLVDTGASEVSIPLETALRLGIPFQHAEKAEYATAGGKVIGHRVVLESVKVGNLEVFGVPAHVSLGRDGPRDILLGMSFLKHVTMTLHSGTVSFSP